MKRKLLTRRSLIAGAGATIIVPKARAWFKPGKSALPAQGQLTFNYIKDSTWTSNPNVTQFEACLAGVVTMFNNYFAFPACTIDLGLSTFSSGGLGQSSNTFFNYSGITDYAGTKAFLLGLPTDNLKVQAYGTLPGSDPSPFSTYTVTSAHYTSCTGGTLHNALQANTISIARDGVNGAVYDYTPDGTTCAAGKVSIFGLIDHEISEVVGRYSGLPSSVTKPLDLLTYTALNTRSFSPTAASRYYSIDSGATNTGGTDGVGNHAFYYAASLGDTGGWGGSYQSPYNEQTLIAGIPGVPLTGDARQLGCLWPFTATGAAYAGI